MIWRTTRKLLCLIGCFCCASALAQSPDHAREKRWADEVTPGLVVGDAITLSQANGHRFLALHTANTRARAGVIVVHGMGVHPDWNLIGALRAGLAEQGYATLSIQMPVLAADAKGELYPALFADAAERLHAAVKWLRDRGHRKIAIVSHSMGARMVNHFLVNGGTSEIDAWAAVGISTGEYLQAQLFKAPVLDIYGEKDFPVVLKQSPQRAAAIKHIRGSGQIQVASADHYFNGAEAELTLRIKQFLDQVTR
jgi:pimeloyl-ACP methyl ester carboxylesterase